LPPQARGVKPVRVLAAAVKEESYEATGLAPGDAG